MQQRDSPFWYPDKTIRYHVIPPVFVIFFTAIVQYLVIVARGEEFAIGKAYENIAGNSTSWKWVAFIILWATVSLKIPSKIAHGPETSFGYKPPYRVSSRKLHIISGYRTFFFTILLKISCSIA